MFRELKGLHRIANSSIEANSNATSSDHVTPVAKHLQRHFASGNEEKNFFAGIVLRDFEHLFPNVMNRRNEKRNDVFFMDGKGVDGFADEALAANGIFSVVNTGVGKPSRRA